MPKKQSEAPADNDRRVRDYLKEFDSWRMDLKRYWPEMDKWQEMYEFYKSKSERSETDTNISLNTPFAMVESQIAKENQASVRITVNAKPENDIGEFAHWIESVLHDAIEDPDVAEIHGTFRKTKEKFSRALKVVGNAVAEINYCYKTELIDGEKKVIADNPYVKTRHFKSVIFNPAMQFANSDRYYIEDWVSMEDLTRQEYKEEKDGSSKGIYKNLGELKLKLKDNKESKDLKDDEEIQYISGDTRITRKNKPIQIITRWEGTKMTVLGATGKGQGVIIREEIDPHKLGGHNLLLGMRYIIEGRPYAYGDIAAIYKPVRAQDTIVAQGIEIVNRYLRGSYVLGPGVDLDQFMLVLANGGAMEGDVNAIANVPVNTPPAAAFQQVDVLQQAIERAGRFSLYSAGITGQATDKTKGTATGIQSIQAAAEPNVEIQLDDVQDMFMRPLARKFLKMIGRLMGEGEIRYGLLRGETKEWVKATKGILLGKATIQDMVTVGLLTPENAQGFLMTEEPMIDPITGQPMVDPMTGQPLMQEVPIPGAAEALVFDVDWIVDAKLDNQSAADKEAKNEAELNHVMWGMQIGVPINPEKAFISLGKRKGFEDIENLLFSPEELEQQQMEAQAQQQQMMMQQQETQAMQGENELQKQAQAGEQQMQLEAMKMQGALQLKQTPDPLPIIA